MKAHFFSLLEFNKTCGLTRKKIYSMKLPSPRYWSNLMLCLLQTLSAHLHLWHVSFVFSKLLFPWAIALKFIYSYRIPWLIFPPQVSYPVRLLLCCCSVKKKNSLHLVKTCSCLAVSFNGGFTFIFSVPFSVSVFLLNSVLLAYSDWQWFEIVDWSCFHIRKYLVNVQRNLLRFFFFFFLAVSACRWSSQLEIFPWSCFLKKCIEVRLL